jgi:site-specific DNA recombinase
MVTGVAAYARVSTDRQADSQTIEQQVERLRAYALQQGWALATERVYRDEGASGARLDRPALDRLRDAVARGDVEVVLVTSPDRLARRYAYQVWLLEEFERAGCQVVFLERPPTGDPQDALVIQIRGAVAEYERAVIADRMRRGRLAALRAGRLLPWSVPPYGYRLDPLRPRDPAAVRVEAAEAAVVRRIFAWYVEDGLPLYAVAKRLTAEGTPTATGRPFWSGSAVRAIVVNHAYRGTAYGNRQQSVPARRRHPLGLREPKGPGGATHRLRPPEEWIGVPVPALVSEERFALAQARLALNRQRARRNTRAAYLVRGLLSCGRCGLAHTVQNNGRYAYYRCTGLDTQASRRRGGPCHVRQVPTARLDAVIWDDVCRLLAEPAVLADALQRARRGWLSDQERAARRQDLRRRQLQVQRQIQRLVDAYAAEALTLEELRGRRATLEERLAALRREEQQGQADEVHHEHLLVLAARAEEFRATLARGLERASFEQRRAIVELLIDRVVVDAPAVEIRYAVPLSGVAQRNGALRPRHRARPLALEAAAVPDARLQTGRLGRHPGAGARPHPQPPHRLLQPDRRSAADPPPRDGLAAADASDLAPLAAAARRPSPQMSMRRHGSPIQRQQNRRVRTTRSAIALARGARTGVKTVSMPSPLARAANSPP